MMLVLVDIMCIFWSDIIIIKTQSTKTVSIYIYKTYPYNNKQKRNYNWEKREKAVLVLCANASLKHVFFNSLIWSEQSTSILWFQHKKNAVTISMYCSSYRSRSRYIMLFKIIYTLNRIQGTECLVERLDNVNYF